MDKFTYIICGKLYNGIEPEFKENHKIKHAQGWKELKRFAEVYYPTTEIISVNPVGLRGMFKDLYTITH